MEGTKDDMSEPINVQPSDDEPDALDPDGDPTNMNPRDTLDQPDYGGDPDSDPTNMNPRQT